MKTSKIKIIGIMALALVMAFCMTACGSQSDEASSGDSEEIAEVDSASFDENKDKPFEFETVDFDGNEVSLNDFSDAKLIMVNFWEPWCGPCVEEMPDLEKLYEKYKDQGFVILGAFSSTDMDEDAKSIIEDSGVTYPILRANDEMNEYMTNFYPTTIFIDGSGKVLSEDPVVGSHSYGEWDAIVQDYLGD